MNFSLEEIPNTCLPICQGLERRGVGDGEETQVDPLRGPLDVQDREDHRPHRHGLLGHGPRLQAARQAGQEDGTGQNGMTGQRLGQLSP